MQEDFAVTRVEHEEIINELLTMLKRPIPDFTKMSDNEIIKFRNELEKEIANSN